MNLRTRSPLSVIALALLTASCLGDPVKPETTGPDPIEPAPAFEAVSANDRPLPTFINADGSSQSGRQLTRASMLLVAPDSLRLILSTRHVAETGEIEATASDTLHAHIRGQDSTLVFSPMGTYPQLLKEEGTIDRNGIVLTVEQPLPSFAGAVGMPPVKLHLQRPVSGLGGQ
jgi:hypothetical protein